MARLAVNRIVQQINGEPATLEPEFTRVSLVVRDSTAAPSSARLKNPA